MNSGNPRNVSNLCAIFNSTSEILFKGISLKRNTNKQMNLPHVKILNYFNNHFLCLLYTHWKSQILLLNLSHYFLLEIINRPLNNINSTFYVLIDYGPPDTVSTFFILGVLHNS